MRPRLTSSLLLLLSSSCFALTTAGLRLEHLPNPEGVETAAPRFSWQVASPATGAAQTAYRLLVASSPEKLAADTGDLWDTGKVASNNTLLIAYEGKPLASGQAAFWKVQVWDEKDQPSAWSEPARWSMGLLKPEDWTAQWISFKDTSPLHTDRAKLFLPPAHHYRKDFKTASPVVRATLYSSALGLGDLYLNGQRVTENYFEPGWSDYVQRAYYRTHDVTKLVRNGDNRLGAIVADGWYAGYVGYSLLVGYGPQKNGRNHYGKTPALLAQLVLEHADGSREVVATDNTWETSGDGPVREADFLMGENFDASREDANWCVPASLPRQARSPAPAWKWETAINAGDNGPLKAKFFESGTQRDIELGFQKPAKLATYTAPPIRVTQELAPKKITEPKPGVYLFDFGQNFAGNVRLSVKGEAGTKITLRYGEMLHPDGTLMTENLRKARATDTYVLAGGGEASKAGRGVETWTPRFTYHGFQYVEVSGLKEKPDLGLLTGLVLHNDTPATSTFACSDEVMTQFWKNTTWTQRANFIEVPTDCPQRDERLGWMGDAQVYVRTATYNADTAAFYTKWLDDLAEAQRPEGPYPDYAPYPMAHGKPGQTWGVAWTDAGIIVPSTVWKVYGDTRVIERQWPSMTKFMEWRAKRAPDFKGKGEDGNPWGDWLNVGETTPVAFIDACYYALDAGLMADMAQALGKKEEAKSYNLLQARLGATFRKDYLNPDKTLKVNTQTAYALALGVGVIPAQLHQPLGEQLAKRVQANDFRMATGFLGTRSLLPSLTLTGQHDLAVRLFQSRRFPSWGYEVANGATSVWERWDSFTKEHGFNGTDGKQNAAMNSFSHYSFGAVMGWGFRDLAGIDMAEPGYRRFLLKPQPPRPGSNPENKPLDWVRASYDSPVGTVSVSWKVEGKNFVYEATLPANTTAELHLPARTAISLERINGQTGGKIVRNVNGVAVLDLTSGPHRITTELP